MIRRLERFVGIASAVALVLLMLIVLVDVLGRDLLNRPLPGGTELTELLLGAMAFLAFPLLAYRQRHITVDLVEVDERSALGRVQVVLDGVVGGFVFGCLTWQLSVLAQRAMASGESTPQLQIPVAVTWWTMTVLAAATTLAALVVAAAALAGRPVTRTATTGVD